MESHLVEIDTWEFIKGVSYWAFWIMWFIIKNFWWVFVILILVKILEMWLWKKRKSKSVKIK